MMKDKCKKALSYASDAITREFPFLWISTILMTSIDSLFVLFADQRIDYAFIIIGANYIIALAFLLIIQLGHLIKIGTILKYIIETVIAFYFSIQLFCWIKFGDILSKGMIALINGTNHNETKEFFNVYITTNTIIGFSITVIVILLTEILVTRNEFKASRRMLRTSLCFAIISCACLGFSFYTIPGRIEAIFRTQKKDLTKYLQNPTMIPTRKDHPDIIMAIIGESYVRSHSSLYGYEKTTCPKLQKRLLNSELVLYTKAVSPATHTAESFTYFMTEYTHQIQNKEWWECLTIPESMNKSGYNTAWFSNQEYTGWHDNISSSFSDLCNKTLFLSKTSRDKNATDYDMSLIPHLKKHISTIRPGTKNLIFVHLLGQHYNYKSRYPDAFSVFKEDDYQDKPENQRSNYANYDNATLYNDVVVDSILSLVKGKDAISLYFSDHGQDFYVSSPDYCSHSNDNNPISYNAGIQIPFIIHTTETYRSLHKKTIDKIEQSKDSYFNLENLFPLILEISGYKKKK